MCVYVCLSLLEGESNYLLSLWQTHRHILILFYLHHE